MVIKAERLTDSWFLLVELESVKNLFKNDKLDLCLCLEMTFTNYEYKHISHSCHIWK